MYNGYVLCDYCYDCSKDLPGITYLSSISSSLPWSTFLKRTFYLKVVEKGSSSTSLRCVLDILNATWPGVNSRSLQTCPIYGFHISADGNFIFPVAETKP